MKAEEILTLVQKHEDERGGLIALLEALQAKYGYLPEPALKLVAETTGRPLVEVYGVATFYKSFSLVPRGKHLVSVCLGTACHVRGAPMVAEEFERQLGIRAGQTTPDQQFTLLTVNCLGACALGPIVVVNGHYFANVAPAQVKEIIGRAGVGLDKVRVRKGDERTFPVEVGCPRCNHSLMDSSRYIDGYPSIRVTVSFQGEHGWLRLSSLYGSFAVEYEHQIPIDAVVHFFCPHCHAELSGGADCPECGAPMVPMLVRGGGTVQICSRRGCRGHMLDLVSAAF